MVLRIQREEAGEINYISRKNRRNPQTEIHFRKYVSYSYTLFYIVCILRSVPPFGPHDARFSLPFVFISRRTTNSAADNTVLIAKKKGELENVRNLIFDHTKNL